MSRGITLDEVKATLDIRNLKHPTIFYRGFERAKLFLNPLSYPYKKWILVTRFGVPEKSLAEPSSLSLATNNTGY